MGANGEKCVIRRSPCVLARRRWAMPVATVGAGAHTLSQAQGQEAVLPPAGLFADNGSEQFSPAIAANLLRPSEWWRRGSAHATKMSCRAAVNRESMRKGS